MTKRERVNRIIKREKVDFLPSQITFSDRTRDDALTKALGLKQNTSLDDFLQNHLFISLIKADYPLFLRNDVTLMRELEKDGYCRVDLEKGVVYDSWGMGVKMGSDGFFASFHPLEKKLTKEFAEKWMPERIWKAVQADTIEERVKLWTPPDPAAPGNYDWMKRDIEEHGSEFFIVPSGYFGLYERGYGMIGLPQMFENMAGNPALVTELLEKITDYKIEVAKRMVKFDVDAGHMGDDLGTQVGPFFSADMFHALLKPMYKKLFGVYKAAGKKMMMHSCGCITQFLPDLIECGLDVIEPVQPCMGLPFIKKEYGKDLTFWGGIDTQDLLPFGSPERIRKEAAEVIRLLGKGGGHIIAPSQEIMNDVPLQNIVALVETIVEEREKAAAL
ncbi:MAG: hypothetical protein E4H36_11575 [Spirochaetales bacterium]|nr:MAG: hypothetical protein E4H36_11575 [Spirochaetales bacterium]